MKVPETAEEVGDALGLGCRRQHEAHHLVLQLLHSLHERVRRRRDIDPAEGQNRLPRQHERVALDRQAGKPCRAPSAAMRG